jgi:hypothetical protein
MEKASLASLKEIPTEPKSERKAALGEKRLHPEVQSRWSNFHPEKSGFDEQNNKGRCR